MNQVKRDVFLCVIHTLLRRSVDIFINAEITLVLHGVNIVKLLTQPVRRDDLLLGTDQWKSALSVMGPPDCNFIQD